jgi:hypothetical protein
MLDELIELSTTLVNPHHQPNISSLNPSSSHTMPPRRRAHSKSQSISSDVNSNKLPSSPLSKFQTPSRRTPRQSTTSPPASPTFSFAPEPKSVPAPVSQRKSQIPKPLQFPLVVVLSLALSSLLFSLIAEFTTGDLASISKHSESWAEIAGLLGWKVIELGVYWFGGYDGINKPFSPVLNTSS